MSAIAHPDRARAAVVLLALVASLMVAAERPAQGSTRRIALILSYRVAATCPVYPNYPKTGVHDNDIGWTISPGDIVGWRYNINATWSMISDRKYAHSTSHPWWGITRRACLGTSVGGEPFPTPESSYPAGEPVPSRLLEGRSAVEADHWRSVDFNPSPMGSEVDPYHPIKTKGTMRDGPNNFVIGNVNAGWHVHTMNLHSQGWTFVYVFNAKRWGWVEDIHL